MSCNIEKGGQSLFYMLIPLVLALPFAMDIYVPAVPSMTEYFNTSTAMMQLTLTLFMLVSGFVQMLIGPLADHFGRRRLTLYLGILFGVGCAMCAVANQLSVLLLGRAVQAVGSCGMMVMGFTIAKDMYSGAKLAKVCSYLNMVVACSPLFAPSLGGLIYVHMGWRFNFIALCVLAVMTVLLHWRCLPETIQHKQLLHRRLLSAYRGVLQDRCFRCYSTAAAFGLTYIFLFCAMSPVVLITELKVPVVEYGYYFAFMGVSFFMGGMLSAMLVDRLGIYRTVIAGFMLSLVGGVWMFVWHVMYGMSPWGFVVPMLVIGCGGSCSMSAGSAGAVTHFTMHTGLASALCTGIRFAFAAIIGMLVSGYVHTSVPLSASAIVFSCLGLWVFVSRRSQLSSI